MLISDLMIDTTFLHYAARLELHVKGIWGGGFAL